MNIRLSEWQKNQSYSSPEPIATLMRRVLLRENRLSRSQEHFWVMGLNNEHRLLYLELIGLGRQNSVAANPPDIFRTALHRLALRIVLVHNHPSGNIAPSQADKSFTSRMIKVGELIGIEVLDHLIITEQGGYTSFNTAGILDELRRSQRWHLIGDEQYEAERMLRAYRQKEMAHAAQRHTRPGAP